MSDPLEDQHITAEAPAEPRAYSRRRVLNAAGAGALAAWGAGHALRASATALASATPAAKTDAALPNRIPGDPAIGLPDAYTGYPSSPFKSVSGTPGAGGTVTTFQIDYWPPVLPHDRNPYWKELDKRLGVMTKSTFAPQPSYATQLQTLAAGNNFPDLTYINLGQGAQAFEPLLLQGVMTDLTPYLTGPALKEFPNLALIPSVAWEAVKIQGKIFGVPRVIPPIGETVTYRRDWAQALGFTALRNAEDVFKMLVAFSKKHPAGPATTFGLASFDGSFTEIMFNMMFRVPNQWRLNADGSLTHQIETAEYKESLKFMRRLWAAGAYDPDSPSLTFSQFAAKVQGGTIGVGDGGYQPIFGATGLRGLVKQLNPKADIYPFVPPGYDGGKGVTYNRQPFFGFTGIPSSVGKDITRLKELLRILNYYAAPFGSEEFTFIEYGIKGRDYTLDAQGIPVPINSTTTQDIGPLRYLVDTIEDTFFYPGANGASEAILAQNLGRKLLQIGINDPTVALYSPTSVSKGAVLNQLAITQRTAIVTGREPLSALATWQSEWRSRGGDQIRTEFEQALKKKG